MPIDHDAWRVLCHHNPGIAIYPHRVAVPTTRMATRPAVPPAVRPAAPAPDIALPPVTRWRWWRRGRRQ